MMLSPNHPMLAAVRLRRELLAAGWNDRAIRAALRHGSLARVRHGAYVNGAVWRAMPKEAQYAVRCRAAYRQARADVVLSHTSALPFLGVPMWGIDLDDVHLTREDNRGGRREAGVCQHRGRILDADVVTAHGVKVTSPTRAALEATTVVGPEPALAVVNFLLHTGVTTIELLRERYERELDHWPNTLKTNLVMKLADPRIESVGETRVLWLLDQAGWPLPEPQHEVRDNSGRVFARLDFAWPELGVWLEFDGRVKYEKLLAAGESVTDVVLREKKREETITALTGWRCVRITWDDLADPARLLQRIRDAVRAAARVAAG
jgi:hypothetical protein